MGLLERSFDSLPEPDLSQSPSAIFLAKTFTSALRHDAYSRLALQLT
jgi:hypothetical protein